MAETVQLAFGALSLLGGFLGTLVAGAAVYGAIRADIRNIHASTTRAHERIDAILNLKP